MESASGNSICQKKQRSLRLFLVAAIVVSIASVITILSYVRQVSDAVAIASAIHEAESRTDSIRVFRTFYSSEVVDRIRHLGIAVTHDYKQREDAVPLPATLTTLFGEKLSDGDSRDAVRLYSAYPFPWRVDGGPKDSFEREALRRLVADPSKPYYAVEDGEHGKVLRYATADVMRESCLECHNTHPDTPKNDWKLGDVRGVVATTISLAPLTTASADKLSGVLILLVSMAGVGCILFVISLISQTRRASREATVAAKHEHSLRENMKLEKAVMLAQNQKLALDEHAIVSIADIRGIITFTNDKFCKISGYSREELLGNNHRMVKSEEHSPEFYRNMWLKISKGEVWSGEIKNRAKNGSFYWVHATIVPFRDVQGKVDQYVAIRTDITNVKNAEEAAQRLYAKLEAVNLDLETQKRKTEAVNAELKKLNEDLEQAKFEAIRATNAKSDFLANMSHEIRTPMTAILGFSENLLEGDLSESEVKDSIDIIHKNGEYLLGLINDILDVSKIEAGKMQVECVPCSPLAVIAEVVELMKVRSDAKNIAFDVEYIGSLPETIQTDPTRLKQILINIVSNAIKFTEEGGVRLITRFVPDNGDDKEGALNEPHLQFDILDTGIGMTKEQAGKLFQPFSQADDTMTRRFGGTGLGLTICKEFSEMLGGGITIVDTELGCGTRFRTTISTGSLSGVKMIEPVMVSSTPKTATLPESRYDDKPLDCRILLAEDGPDNQRLISLVLKRAGADVVVAENGQVAIEKATAAVSQGKPFDVILMDMQMPVLDGYQATMMLRNQNYEGPIIALTAHAMASDREKCINCGCNGFATKPIERKVLIETIRAQLRTALAL